LLYRRQLRLELRVLLHVLRVLCILLLLCVLVRGVSVLLWNWRSPILLRLRCILLRLRLSGLLRIRLMLRVYLLWLRLGLQLRLWILLLRL
jgi:hypothetical protein